MEKKIKMLPPHMPNFLPTEYSTREDGSGPLMIPVNQLSHDEAIEYGELMKQSFIKHWEKHTKNGKN
jgi:hypothetical protein